MRKLKSPQGTKILCLDIETAPALAYVWDMWNVNINIDALVATQEMLCWAAKWLGESEVEYRSSYHDSTDIMIERIWDLLDQADMVIHYNGRRFDIPHLNREFLEADYLPPSPYQQIDLYQTVKRRFRFTSGKLAHVSEVLGLGGKVEHEGFRLWLKCLNDDKDAWDRMKEYNIQDTLLLEDLYIKLRPWVASHPSIAAVQGENVCPKCGSDSIEYRGYVNTKMSRYRRFCCNDCGSWGRVTKRTEGIQVTEVPL